MSMTFRKIVLVSTALVALAAFPVMAGVSGPYNAEFTSAGDGLKKVIKPTSDPVSGNMRIAGWIKPQNIEDGAVVIASLADDQGAIINLTLDRGRLALVVNGANVIASDIALKAGAWAHVTATSDGRSTKLYLDGKQVAQKEVAVSLSAVSSIGLGPRGAGKAFVGRIAGLTVSDARTLDVTRPMPPQEDLIAFETGSPSWPIQVRQMYGQVAPQDAWTLPTSRVAPTKAVVLPAYSGPVVADNIVKGWRLAAAPEVKVTGKDVSSPGFDASRWLVATTPGTVLTTYVDRGVYPDPDYGLNNLAIPEKLNRQDYWYRTEFTIPADLGKDEHFFVTFNGVNYQAEVWVNGRQIGSMKGAFVRGRFDLSPFVTAGQPVAIALKVSPPPHPGIAHEESLSAGPGDNGGQMAQDGPTFVAAEGWDWIPSVRDRNTGLWQDVVLSRTGAVRLGDSQVITDLVDATNRQADVTLIVPVENLSSAPVTSRIEATLSGGNLGPVVVSREVTLPPGQSSVTFSPKEYEGLRLKNPKLWWPNGYGDPVLHALDLKASTANGVSDSRRSRFGIREVSYELSLVTPDDRLERVEANFTAGRELGLRIVDVSHKATRKIAGNQWAVSLQPEAVNSKAITPVDAAELTPHLVIKVNGVRIAARGGNWGMDDWRKRVSRERLEPYYRLHKEANVNIIRNWVGQNTQDVFFDLADEYGLMVMNDFWASTQDYQLEPQDVPLFMSNAEDVVRRYRNHPSIIMWFGRNEGVPQPVLNEALQDLIYREDGTRWYAAASNRVNLSNSGPYAYRPPVEYFTRHAKGFSVEVGTASFPTKEAFEAMVPEADRWPISDSWAYHDWHSSSNGTTKPFEEAMARQFGAPQSFEDFERKAQMMNYDNHRAIFEGMNAGLWKTNSGRMLWMTQPAWPSTMWQIFSHDYDTHGAFYGVKSASEPIHIQMNLPNFSVAIVNNPPVAIKGAKAKVRVFGLDGALLSEKTQKVSVGGVAISSAIDFSIGSYVAKHRTVVVELILTSARGQELSRNVYWQGREDADLQALNSMAHEPIDIEVGQCQVRDATCREVTLSNRGRSPALAVKMTVLDDKGNRVLPVYYGDNYVSLMPGESRTIVTRLPSGQTEAASLSLRGWNVVPKQVPLLP
jgi:hypothetical protein